MAEQLLIKCLRTGGRSVHSFIDAQGHNSWDLPNASGPGRWKGPVEGKLHPHVNGLHLAKEDYFIDWLTGEHFVAETEGETAQGFDCVIARKARLVEKLPVDEKKLEDFCLNQLTLLPKMLEALDVYPRISQDVAICVELIQGVGLKNAATALKHNADYKNVRQNAMRLSYDALHSIEYQACTETSKTCLNAVVGLVTMSAKKDNIIDHTKVISNNVARSADALHRNFHFMTQLCQQGFNHTSEVAAMSTFLNNYTRSFLSQGSGPELNMANFFSRARRHQNEQVLPALGIIKNPIANPAASL